MYRKSTCAFVCAATLAVAGTSGTVNAVGSFNHNGTNVPASAATSLLFKTGDRIATGDSPVTIRFDQDGAVVTVTPHSTMESGQFNGRPFVRLTAGKLLYTFTPGSDLLIFKRADPVVTKPTGIVAFTSKKLPIAVAVGGAAAVGTTVALVKRSKNCPDGQNKTKDCGNQ